MTDTTADTTRGPDIPSPGPTRMLSRPDGQLHRCTLEGQTLSVQTEDGTDVARWQLPTTLADNTLRWQGPADEHPDEHAVLASLETAFTLNPDRVSLRLDQLPRDPAWLLGSGVLAQQPGGDFTAHREQLWQQPRLWLGQQPPMFAQQYILTQGRRHPRRPPKACGTVYARYIPWLQATYSLRAVDIEQDLERFNAWMNDPMVAHFWQEEGDLARHRAYLQEIEKDPHMTSLIACIDEQPFGYFEVYWAKENRISPFYDTGDHDRGWHVLIGEAAFRGRPYASAWLPSISHYLFLCDPRTQRVVGEPRSDHHRQIRNLQKSGYANVKDFDFPHKRATLVMLLRERYFGDALWFPRADPADIKA